MNGEVRQRYAGKVILVTGGASVFGAACCHRPTTEYATFTILDLDTAAAEHPADPLRRDRPRGG